MFFPRKGNFLFLFLLSYQLASAMEVDFESSTKTHGRKGQHTLTIDEMNSAFQSHKSIIDKIDRLVNKGFKIKITFKTIVTGDNTPDIYQFKVTNRNKWHRPPHSLKLSPYTSKSYSATCVYLSALYIINNYEDTESVILRNFQHIKYGSERR